jgi:hypothetical protein
MYPHERSLVEKYQNRPFVIIGVNSDASRELVKQASEKEKLTWRSFWDGGSTDGPIARRWNVNGWPTLYLIDHNGAIVRQVGRDDELIEQKVKEAEAALKK